MALEETNGTVAEVYPNVCSVKLDESGHRILCNYKRNSVFGLKLNPAPFDEENQKWRERAPVAVGDRVKVQSFGSADGVVEGVALRKNFLARPAPGRDEGIVHVIAANIDVLCVVSSAAQPEFTPGLVDRFFVAAEFQEIEPVLCINKVDLLKKSEKSEQAPWRGYEELGYPVIETSAKTKEGLKELKARLIGKKVVFAGHSGVGKTSLLSALTEHDVGKVGAVSDVTGKGRHTTTGAILLDAPGDSIWIDTPGVREFGLLGITPEVLPTLFREFRNLTCPSEGCQHVFEESSEEPACPAISLARYASYRRIWTSLSEDSK